MQTNDGQYFDAYRHHADRLLSQQTNDSFFDHFTEKDEELFQELITVIWKTEYPVMRSAYIFYFPFVNYRDSADPYAISQDELESIIDFLVIFIFLTKEKNSMSLAFAQKEMEKFPSTLYHQAITYFAFSLTPTPNDRDRTCNRTYYLTELVETLRGNRGIRNHYSHKKFELRKEDYCPIR